METIESVFLNLEGLSLSSASELESESTSTSSSSLINSLEQNHNIILKYKKQANDLLQHQKYEESIKIYLNLIEEIDKIKQHIQNNKIFDSETPIYSSILTEYKLINSNLALCYRRMGNLKECNKYDLIIFQKLDRDWHKSYARLVENYLKLGNFTMANYFGSLMKHKFSPQVLKIYEETLNHLEKERPKHQKNIGDMLSGMNK